VLHLRRLRLTNYLLVTFDASQQAAWLGLGRARVGVSTNYLLVTFDASQRERLRLRGVEYYPNPNPSPNPNQPQP
jgi:hypothetical protein